MKGRQGKFFRTQPSLSWKFPQRCFHPSAESSLYHPLTMVIERNVCPLTILSKVSDNIVGFVLAQLVVLNPMASSIWRIKEIAPGTHLGFGTTCLIIRKHLCSESCLPASNATKCESAQSASSPGPTSIETINGIGMKKLDSLNPSI